MIHRAQRIVFFANMALLTLPACPREPGGPCSSSDDCLIGERYSEVCVDNLCRQVCTSSVACLEGEACLDGVCLPATARPDAAMADRVATDSIAFDAARADAGDVDVGSRDASVTDLPSNDTLSTDVSGRDLLAPDTAAPDTAAPDTTGPDTTPPLCPNGVVDPREACDGQSGCGPDCQPLPGHDCGLDSQLMVVCYPVFPSSTPSHLGDLDFSPFLLTGRTLDCSTDAPVDTDQDGSSSDFCGQDVPSTTVVQDDGLELRVFAFRGLAIHGELRLTGSRAPVIVVFGDALIDGIVDVGALGTMPGPGGVSDCGASAGAIGMDNNDCGGGGGGGGNAAAGGNGGAAENNPGGLGDGAAGGAAQSYSGLLRGGCPGGPGGWDSQLGGTRASYGAGGGALQISTAGALALSGTIIADGSGGAGGQANNKGGGGGGGSGGTLFLEARVINVGAALLVLGGGGGGEGASSSASGLAGQSGRYGGAGGGQSAGAGFPGGAGGPDTAEGGHGINGTQSGDLGGGGGGGSGGSLNLSTLQ